jgi:transcriptional regulator with XRE-family HTH domain
VSYAFLKGWGLAMTPPQIRAARGLLNWTVQELAEKAGLDRNTVAQIESGRYASDAETMAAIRRALEAAGIEFTNGRWPGVRLRPERRRQYYDEQL